LEVFSAASQGQESLRSEHGLGGKKLLVYAGAFGVANGTAYLVELAYACLKVDSTVVIVGLGDGKERPEVLDYAREKGVLDNNLLLPGSVAKHEAARWVQSADLALALFTGPRVLWKDATQNKFFDALAAGVPMACNFRGWQCEIAEENSVGFVLDADDPDAAARLVSTKLSDASWVAGARKRSRELASTEYSMDKHATRLEAILDKAAQA
ncbi:MAG: glycosyltransferase, partial [Pseudomonadota bacterium]